MGKQATNAVYYLTLPITIWITTWSACIFRYPRLFPPAPIFNNSLPSIRLRVGQHFFKVIGAVAVGLAVYAIASQLIVLLSMRNVQVSPLSILIVAPVAAMLAVSGPLLGLLINQREMTWSLLYVLVALPPLLVAIIPFWHTSVPVHPKTAVWAWCKLISAHLFWVATGLLSLFRHIG